MPIQECYDDLGYVTACSNLEYVQQWYNALQQWQNNPEAGSANISQFFETHLNPFINPESGQLATSDQFLHSYGQYITDLIPDFGALDRHNRIADLKKNRFQKDYGAELSKRQMEIGHRGFSGAGESLGRREEFLDRYTTQAGKADIQATMDLETLYGQWGSNFITSLETLQESAFGDSPAYEDVGTWTFENCLNDCSENATDFEGLGWQDCLNSCVGIGG